jgi:hypothetical protein
MLQKKGRKVAAAARLSRCKMVSGDSRVKPNSTEWTE